MGPLNGLEDMLETWTTLLEDLVRYSGGNVVEGQDTVYGENRTNEVANYLQQVE